MNTSIKERVLQVMATVFETEVAALNENSSTDTIEAWDSLKHLTLILSLEEEFGIRIPDEEVGELINYKLIEITHIFPVFKHITSFLC
jgi:acyl carrier protein